MFKFIHVFFMVINSNCIEYKIHQMIHDDNKTTTMFS